MPSYDLAGTSPALVLSHSTVCDREMRDPRRPVFPDARYWLIRCDFRGYGATPVPRGAHKGADDALARASAERDSALIAEQCGRGMGVTTGTE